MQKNELHPNTTAMLQAWRRITSAPGNIHKGPSADQYPELLGRLFVIESTRSGYFVFRIAGDDLTGLFSRNLVGTNLLDLWQNDDRALLLAFLEGVANGNNPGIIRAIGETRLGRHSEVELALAPLKKKPGHGRRLLGLYQTLGGNAAVNASTIWTHYLRSIDLPYPELESPKLQLVASND